MGWDYAEKRNHRISTSFFVLSGWTEIWRSRNSPEELGAWATVVKLGIISPTDSGWQFEKCFLVSLKPRKIPCYVSYSIFIWMVFWCIFGGEFVQIHHSQRFEASPSRYFFPRWAPSLVGLKPGFGMKIWLEIWWRCFFPLKVRHLLGIVIYSRS